MTRANWSQSGTDYSLSWGGQQWDLSLGRDRPALRREDTPLAGYLSLEGLGAPGRSDREAFSPRSLVRVEQSRSSLQATYVPKGWAGLRLQATWTPTARPHGMDLDVQVTTSSVGELKAVEVYIATRLFAQGDKPSDGVRLGSVVTPRDARSAGLSYDGREARDQLRLLTTNPVPGPVERPFGPFVLACTWPEQDIRYIEMVHPHDVSRRIAQRPIGDLHVPGSDIAVRYGLFGHDLEKGVIVRGRLRGLWVAPGSSGQTIAEAYEEFLDLPSPLGS